MLAIAAPDLNGHTASVGERLGVLAGEAWPPRGVEPIEVERLYDVLMERGFEYGPVFQGLRAVWRRGEDVFAEVELSSELREEAALFGVHPALLDAALHAGLSSLAGGEADGETDGESDSEAGKGAREGGLRLPFSFGGVELHVPGASSLLRVSLGPRGQ